jgi:predicted aldo/keto reductase-like oxidoreductase
VIAPGKPGEKETSMKNNAPNLKRRSFLKWGAAGLAGLAVNPAAGNPARKQQPAEPAKKNKFVLRPLAKTGLRLPIVSMGVMNADNPELVRAALDRGIVLLDTANGYQRGRNETMIGEVLKGRPRDSFVIATKVPAESTSEEYLRNFEVSLRRLGLDHVDILHVHDCSSKQAVMSEPVLKALEKIKKDGKARFVGVSTHSNEPEVIRAVVEGKFHDVVLTAYNFRQRNREDIQKAIAEAAAAGVGIIAMKTQAGRFWDKARQQPINMKAALKWVLNDPNVTTAIPGMTTFDQLDLDLSVMEELALTETEKRELQLEVSSAGLYCQQCGRCRPGCPENLPLPSLMRSYMYAYGYRNLGAAYDLLQELDLPTNPCGSCISCTVRCVQGFDVADRVKDIVRLKDIPADFFA